MECIVCGRKTNSIHHLLFGTSNRSLCDGDYKRGARVAVPVCDYHHTIGNQAIHGNASACELSKRLGEANWVLWYIEQNGGGKLLEEARSEFYGRYGRLYNG